jgi:multidrug efflux pump subunit AcrA (membrane-fusion protein)
MYQYLLIPFLFLAAPEDALNTRLPMNPQQTAVSAAPAPPVVAAQRDPNLIRVRGDLRLPKRNEVVLAATERAVLMSLQTEKRDAEGQIIRDAGGNPVMVPVVEGMQVFKGQVLGNFDDRELNSRLNVNEAELKVSEAERDKTIEIDYAELGRKVAEKEVQMMQEANQRVAETYPKIEVMKAALATKQAEANRDLQTYTIEQIRTREVEVKQSNIDATKVLISLRKLIAPIDGMVVEIKQTEGEWLREGDPVVQIWQLNKLRLFVKVDAKLYDVNEVSGKNATVYVKLVDGTTEKFQGKVEFVYPKIDQGDTFATYIEVQNRRNGNTWLLQPGQWADAVIHLK